RVDHGHDAAFGLRERETVVRADHAAHHTAIRKGRATVRHVRHRAVAADDEAHRHRAFEVRVSRDTLLVVHTETAVALANDTLNDFRREAAAAAGRAHADLRCACRVSATETAVTGAEALARTGAGAVTERADRSETDTFAATTATFADAG